MSSTYCGKITHCFCFSEYIHEKWYWCKGKWQIFCFYTWGDIKLWRLHLSPSFHRLRNVYIVELNTCVNIFNHVFSLKFLDWLSCVLHVCYGGVDTPPVFILFWLGRVHLSVMAVAISRNWWYFPHKYSSYLN